MPGRQEVPTFLECGNGAKMIIFNNIFNPLRSPRPPERPATGQAPPSPERPAFTFIRGLSR
jgi:hypothetical protein